MHELNGMLKLCCGGRRLFVTRNGYIGLCPPYAQPGDIVFVVSGISIPVLLRRCNAPLAGTGSPETSARKFQLVGETYCHGLINEKKESARITEHRKEIEIV
jgi:hypothetical protein